VEITPVEAENHVAVVVENPKKPKSAPKTTTQPTPKLIGRAPEWLSVLHQVARAREGAEPVLLAGETGVGKTSVALGRPFVPGADGTDHVIDAAESHLTGVQQWLRTVSGRLEAGTPVC